MKRKGAQEKLLELLATARFENEIIINDVITYGDLFEEMQRVLPDEHKEMLFQLESSFSESLAAAVQRVYKVGFKDAITLMK